MTELPPPTEPDRPALRRFSKRARPEAAPPTGQSYGQPGPYQAPYEAPYSGGPEQGWPAPAAARPRRGRIIAPIAAAVAVAAVVGGVIAFRAGGSDGANPPQLALVDAGAPVPASADSATAERAGLGLGGDYKVAGSLPTTPTKEKVRNLPGGQASQATVTKLAAALGVSGEPRRLGGSWVVGADGSPQLRVMDGGGQQWLYDNARPNTSTGGMACDVIINGKRACLPGQALPGGGGGKVIPIDPPAGGLPGDDSSGYGSSGSSGNAGSGGGSSTGGGGGVTGSKPGSDSVDPAPGSYPGTSAPDDQVPDAPVGSGAPAPDTVVPPAPPIPGTTGMPVPRGTAVPMPTEPTGPTPDEARVRDAAMKILNAIGLGNAEVRVQTFPSIALVTAAPVVDGLPTAGIEVRLQYNAKYELTGGSGWLATPTLGAEYPLVTAQQALDALPKPEIARGVCTDRMPATCVIPQRVITGARLGLALRHNRTSPLLVPAWLYTVQGDDLPPLVVVAVDPKYLAPEKGGPGPGVNSPAPAPPIPPHTGRPIPLPEPTK
jgi:hypothetical protein